MSEKLTFPEKPPRKLVLDEFDLPPTKLPNWDRTLKFFKGEPWVRHNDRYHILVPDQPHVFSGLLETQDNSGQLIRRQSNILLAHGFRGQNGNWTFKDGRSVKEFIDLYNANNPSEVIDFAAVCNLTNDTHGTVEHVVGSDFNALVFRDQEADQTVVNVAPSNPMVNRTTAVQ